MVRFDCSPDEKEIINQIASRAVFGVAGKGASEAITHAAMNITATHLNGCPLRLADLLAAGDVDFVHDVVGIDRYLNRDTGQLEGRFRPRFAQADTSEIGSKPNIAIAANGWFPIASAPRDGTAVELWRPPATLGWSPCRVVGKWSDLEKMWIWPNEDVSAELAEPTNNRGYPDPGHAEWEEEANYYMAASFTHWAPLKPQPAFE